MDIRSPESTAEYRAELQQARQDIQTAYYAGLFSAGITFMVFLVVISNPATAQRMDLDGWLFIDVVLASGLTYGIYRKNPLCAKIMLGYFIISKLIQFSSGNFSVVTVLVSGFFLRCFYRGVVGTSAYQRLQAEHSERDLPIASYREEIEPTRNMSPETGSAEKFWVADRLIELCGDDRSQAEWLLHQLRRKHPGKSMDWYNDLAIEEVNTRVRL